MDYRDRYIECLEKHIRSLEAEIHHLKLCPLSSHRWGPYVPVNASRCCRPTRATSTARGPSSNPPSVTPYMAASPTFTGQTPSSFILSPETSETVEPSESQSGTYVDLLLTQLGPVAKIFIDGACEGVLDKKAATFVRQRVAVGAPVFGIDGKVVVPQELQDDFVNWFRTQITTE
jgi:hypothetical protein